MRDRETRFWVGVVFVVGVAIFFIGAALTGALLEMFSLFTRSGRGLRWYVAASAGGVVAVCSYLAFLEKRSGVGGPWTGSARTTDMVRDLVDNSTSAIRIWFALAFLWMAVVVVVFFVFAPFGRYHDVTRWYRHEWLKFLTILLGPLVLGLLGPRLSSWATRRRDLGRHVDAKGELRHSGRTEFSAGDHREPHADPVYQLLANALAAGSISPSTGALAITRYQTFLERTGDATLARLQLSDWLEEEARRHKKEET